MTDALPTDERVDLEYELLDRTVAFTIDEALYPREAAYGAAYLFVDRCWIYLSRPAEGALRVRLRGKEPLDEAGLDALAGEFANELLNQVVRAQVGEATRALREYTLARAFFGAREQTTIDRLLAELDAEELDEDPLEIEVPWAQSDEAEPG